MKGWTAPLQRASYRGVRFEVISVDDEITRTTIEHAYPFVNGADVEDLGLNPLTVRLQAVFYGEGYYTDFKKFLSVLGKQGADVLVHPIRGRLQNMICSSALFHHEADMIDYVAIDLTFTESTPAEPIFVFESAFLARLDALLTQLEDFVDDVLALYGEFMEVVSFAANIKSRLLGSFGALFGCFEQVRSLFDLDKNKYPISNTVSSTDFKVKSLNSARHLAAMLETGLSQIINRRDLTTRAKFDEMLRTLKQIKQIPSDLVTGKNIKSASQQAVMKSLPSTLTNTDMHAVSLFMRLVSAGVLLKSATELIEDDALLPQDVDYITTKVRSEILENLALLRQQIAVEQQAVNSAGKPNTGLYTTAHHTMEQLKQHAHQFTQLAINAINRKPPLIIRASPMTGTAQQIAHAFYGDYKRADELLRLNPQVRYPNYIEQGEVLNSYVR